MLRPSVKQTKPVTISAVILAKDEEEWLPLCVATIINQVDEVVLIDTKSTDNTVALMRAMAAMNQKVKLHEFESDFDHLHEWNCRNRAIRLTGCDWIMMLDADQLMEDGWRGAVDKHLIDPVCESIAVKYEHWVGSMEYIHESFYRKQLDNSLHPEVPLHQTCLFRNTPTLRARAAADTCPQFRPAHHARADESVPPDRRRVCNDTTLFHAGFIKRKSIYMGIYRIKRGDYGFDENKQRDMIEEINRTHNGFRYVGNVHRVDYGPERVPSVIRHKFGRTYNLELDENGFIQRRTFHHNGELTP